MSEDKSYVSMEQRCCKVCTVKFNTNSILLNRRLTANMDRYTVTGWGLCPDCKKKLDDGYIALIGCDPTKSTPTADKIKPSDAYRTGSIAFIRQTVLKPFINKECPDRMAFVEEAVIDYFKNLQKGDNDGEAVDTAPQQPPDD